MGSGPGESGRSRAVQEAVEEAVAFMKSHAAEERVATLQRYFKEPIQAYGVDYRAFKEWRTGFVARLKEAWTLEDAVAFCDAMAEDPHLEPRGLGFLVVGEFADRADPGLLAHVHRWLDTVCDNWGSVDGLVPTVLSPLLRGHPGLAEEVVGWSGSPNIWVRRGSAVAFVSLMDDEALQDAGYRVATRLLDEKEDLVQKAVGWMLREAGKVDRARLEAFLLEKGPRVPRTTLRYAIEKFPKEDRKRIMEATKG